MRRSVTGINVLGKNDQNIILKERSGRNSELKGCKKNLL